MVSKKCVFAFSVALSLWTLGHAAAQTNHIR